MTDCIFCKIIKKEIPAKSVSETQDFVAFEDIHPKAPVHILVIPKVHVASVQNLEDGELAGEMVLLAKKVAEKQDLEGYKLIFNVGRKGGQVIDHLHLHLLGGWSQKPGQVEV